MKDCIFCKIVGGEMNADFVYEDETVCVFKDLHPKADVHLLVVPKKHIASVAEFEDGDVEIGGKIFLACRNVAKNLGLEGYKLQVNVGEKGGQEIFHLHVHLLAN